MIVVSARCVTVAPYRRLTLWRTAERGGELQRKSDWEVSSMGAAGMHVWACAGAAVAYAGHA